MDELNGDQVLFIQNVSEEIPLLLVSYTLDELRSELRFPSEPSEFFSISEIVLEDHEFACEDHLESKQYYLQSIKIPYNFAFTSEFKKNIDQYKDKKLQGRILEAIIDIADSPDITRGDTKKPLKGDLIGKWRYRIGKFRLIYQPDNSNNTIYLLAILPRGGAYE